MRQIKELALLFFKILLLFLIQKPLFLLVTGYSSAQAYSDIFKEIPLVVWHGLTLDLTMTGYLCILPCLILAISVWIDKQFLKTFINVYLIVASILLSATFVLNVSLYPYWNFPLDTTPFFYFTSSPKDALASTSLWIPFFGAVFIVLLSCTCWFFTRFRHSAFVSYGDQKHRGFASFVFIICAGILFLMIRGGVTVSTANSGKVYYSPNIYYNHSAVNPLFSLMESIVDQKDFAHQYRFMDETKANRIFSVLSSSSDADTYYLLNEKALKTGKPDILIVIMESFASDLFPCLGGSQKNVVPNLDSIARKNVLFTNFYANSFRTDRGIVSVLSGYPAQPTTSIMKYTDKSSTLPSIARSLERAKGYDCSYYYGGDVDFAHQRSYLVSQGYRRIVSDSDFPVKDKLSKWGVPDHIVAEKLMRDLHHSSVAPCLRVFQTSSSHEPFDVPYKRLQDKRLNAFAYTDAVVGNLLREYSKLPRWENTIVLIVPDHVGAYKEHLDNFDISRYQIPLIITGGAVSGPKKIDVLGCQQDIAATLLAQLNVGHSDFIFSKNMLSSSTPKFAFFTVPDAFGFVQDGKAVIFDNKQHKVVYKKGDTASCLLRGKAFLQKLYDDLAKR